AVGGLTPEHVVLRPNGLVGLRAVPAATGTVHGDIAALGALLEACLGGAQSGEAAGRGTRQGAGVPPDLAALVRTARSTQPDLSPADLSACPAEPWTSTSDDIDAVLHDEGWSEAGYRSEGYADTGSTDLDEAELPGARRRLAVVGISVLAFAVVIAIAWWI